MKNTIHTKSFAVTRSWQDVILQLEQGSRIKGQPELIISQTSAACRTFLLNAGYVPSGPVDRPFLSRLEQSLEQDDFGAEFERQAAKCGVNAAELKTSLQAMIRTYNALVHTHFGKLVRACLKTAKMSYEKLAAICGRSVDKIRFWLGDKYGGVTGMAPEEVILIDDSVGAQGMIVSAYAALRQDNAYEHEPSVLHQLLGLESFGARLLALRKRTGRELGDLLLQLEQDHGIRLPASQLDQWERGFYVPSEAARKVIFALDALYQAGGQLIAAWESETPQRSSSHYSLPLKKWSPRVQAQFARLVADKTADPEYLPGSEDPKGGRWGTATVALFQDFCESFFGFLLDEKRCSEAELSLTLLSDWRLVRDFFEFVRRRAQRTNYTTFEGTRTTTLLSLYQWYFPHLAADAAEEAYWENRLPTEASCSIVIAPGVCREHRIPLQNFGERWNCFLAQSKETAKQFLKNNKFKCVSYVPRAKPLLHGKINIAAIAAEVAARIRRLPARILSPKAALKCRRLAEAALLLACAPRPSTLETLRCHQVIITANGKIATYIPGSQFLNRGQAGTEGGIQDLLPDWDFLHEVLRRYIQEARPILLGDPASRGNQDAGYFFTGAFWTKRGAQQTKLVPGGRMGEKCLYHDFLITLGYNARAHRYLAAADARRNGVTNGQIAIFANP